jgi:hypothetical protein
MMAIEVHHAHRRRLGIFWFCGDGRKQSRLVSIPAMERYPTVADRRQLPLSHEEGWLHIQALCPQLSAIPFDYFPRGRLVWHSASNQWFLYVDQNLLRGAFIVEVLLKWNPPKAQLVVLADSQYRSAARIGLPAPPRGD